VPGSVRVAVAGHGPAGQGPVVVACGDDGSGATEQGQDDGDLAGNGHCDDEGAEDTDDEGRLGRGARQHGEDGPDKGDEPQHRRHGCRHPPHARHATGIPWRPARGRGRLNGVLTVAPDALRPWFTPERPGPLVFEHVARTGHGRVRVDRWPDPRVVVAELPDNLALRGDPEHLPEKELAELAGFVDAAPEWLPALRASDPATGVWDRLIAMLPGTATVPPPARHVRLLTPDDAPAFAGLSTESAWIAETWGGVPGLLEARVARGVLVDGQVAALAVPFYLGGTYEDIGVVTEPAHRRRGLSTACTAALIADIRTRGHVPTWSTSPDNAGSRGVAARLGFVHERDDVLYAFRTPIPTS
jgi:RimJ/RimL family protein N-acetyltransferase